jgi:hypothetical protein
MKSRLLILLLIACVLALYFGAGLDRVGFHEGGF